MNADRVYVAIGTATILIGVILFALFRTCRTGRLLLVGWFPRIVQREQDPLRYWFGFCIYLIVVVLSLFALVQRFHEIPQH